MTDRVPVTMKRHLPEDVTVQGSTNDAPAMLRGMARLIEGNYQDARDHPPGAEVTQRQKKVAHLRIAADALEHALGYSDEERSREFARVWMVDLATLLGITGWTYGREQDRCTGQGTSELVT